MLKKLFFISDFKGNGFRFYEIAFLPLKTKKWAKWLIYSIGFSYDFTDIGEFEVLYSYKERSFYVWIWKLGAHISWNK